jgi:hypothetical protein
MRFVIDLWLDGYNTEEEMVEACKEFIEEQLDFSASSVKILETADDFEKEWDDLIKWLKERSQGIYNLDDNLPDGVGGMEIGKAHGYENVLSELRRMGKLNE